MKVQKERRFALLMAARNSDYVKKVYGGYFNVFVEALAGEGEKWDLFRVVDGEFPHMDDLHNYEGFAISGSPHDANGDEYWILELCYLLKTLFTMQKKVLGICFGHQVLCRALGGKVGKAYSGWDIGIRKVYEVPVGAQVLAYSDKTEVEMFTFGDNILGIQGHPEYTKDILDNLIDRLVWNNSIEKGFAEEAKLKLKKAEADRKYWERICKSFLKGRWIAQSQTYF
ncbi:gamma-glutamyl peptidase 5-like isoform X2 [Olea europaea var. sylvestris]|uniref:gamma-glutamyl peptidase 5-like isoform X2 n=1 Tax=Olea europaea var. sylvestris TaxID=158386 RepID=UPI000C1D34C3|nr:gamma-glutamyl peptidase 5-like isoform X2 [Olea europaea var. sylvestris]